MKTEQPVLPWHREAAKEIEIEPDSCKTVGYIAAIIARHDPHAAQHEKTVRLLEEAFHMLNMTPRRPIHEPFHVALHKTNIALADRIRAHLAAMKGTQ